MSLRFFYGSVGSGKTQFFLDEIFGEVRKGSSQNLMLLVPEHSTFQTEKLLAEELGGSSCFNAEVSSLRRLAYKTINSTGDITSPVLRSTGKKILIDRIIKENKDRFKFYAKAINGQNFSSLVLDVFSEFKKYNIDINILNDAIDTPDTPYFLKEKFIELNFIYNAFENLRKEKFRNNEDDLSLAAQNLDLAGYDVWIDGFDDFTPQEFCFLEKIILTAESVSISLRADDIHKPSSVWDIFDTGRETYRKILEFAKNSGISVEAPIFVNAPSFYRFSESPTLAHLERNFTSLSAETYKAIPENLSLSCSLNLYSETESLAKEIIELCREKHFQYNDIAVAAGRVDSYEQHIEDVFAEYKIPFFLDKKRDISNHPLSRLILSLFDILLDDWSYDAVFRYLKSGLTGIEQSKIDIMENYCLSCGVKGSLWTQKTDWDMISEIFPSNRDKSESVDVLNDINKTRKVISGPILLFEKTFRKSKKGSEFAKNLISFLDHIEISKTIENLIANAPDVETREYIENNVLTYNLIMDLLDEIVLTLDDEDIDFERFVQIFRKGLSDYRLASIPPSLNQVVIGNVERIVNMRVKALFLIGANEGEIPQTPRESGLLSDNDRNLLESKNVILSPDTGGLLMKNQLLLYQVLCTPSNYLRISRPIADLAGKALRPATLIQRLRHIFPKIEENSELRISTSNIKTEEYFSIPQNAFKYILSSMKKDGFSDESESLSDKLKYCLEREEEWASRLRKVEKAIAYNYSVSNLKKEAVSNLYGQPLSLSLSKVEKFAGCPFAFFIQYGIKADERKVLELTPLEIGSYLHKAVEIFSKKVAKGEKSWLNPDVESIKIYIQETKKELRQSMENSAFLSSKRFLALLKRLDRIVEAVVLSLFEKVKADGFIPEEFEIGFGQGEKYPPIEIPIFDDEKAFLTGRIDRIDSCGRDGDYYYRIVDYKSSKKDFSLFDFYSGLQLQLVTYLVAIWEEKTQSAGCKVIPEGAQYFVIDDPIKKAKSFDAIGAAKKSEQTKKLVFSEKDNEDKIFESLRKYLKLYLRKLLIVVSEGEISIRPYSKTNVKPCTYCEFYSICRFDINLEGNSYRYLKKVDDKTVWHLMKEAVKVDER